MEQVMFRHWDPQVLAALLPCLDACQFARILGPAAEMALVAEDFGGFRRVIADARWPAAPHGLFAIRSDQAAALSARGGKHGDPGQNVGTSSPRNDGLDSHHMPAKQPYKGTGLDPSDGPAIQMEPEDHQATADYGGRGKGLRDTQAEQIQDGNFDDAFDNSAKNVEDIANSKGEPGKYDQAIKEARAYKDCLKAHGLLPGGGS